ncbi:uncharacterized protein LOC107039392 [Diachasma alloeum]|uniref:uncharacterized protein LOC107039392 n=1 Tax=Diachasma alloeum TaxID=454923 RepID=UPI0007382405|nr:uncharacterized protein LOC107039392 [Diachasma alloeum]
MGRFIMKVFMQELCRFAEAQPSSRNFIESEKLLEAGHVIQWGQTSNDNTSTNIHEALAFCLQTSTLKGNPHEMSGKIDGNGRVIEMTCTCKAGLSGRCKHAVAVLLYCNRNNLEELRIISCTDKKCIWNAPRKLLLENYDAQPLMKHECFTLKKNKLLGDNHNQKSLKMQNSCFL